MLAGLRDLTHSLGQADPRVKAAAYADLGITVTYHADGRALLESRPLIGGVGEDVAGGVNLTRSTRDIWEGRLTAT